MTTAFMNDIIIKLLQSGLANKANLQGCSTSEIEKLEAASQVVLPGAYKEFLCAIGKSAGEFLIGEDVFYSDILNLRGYADELLAESQAGFVLPKSAFVFLMHQGYQFLFFDTASGEDPAVFHYMEKEAQPKEVFTNFSKWLNAILDDEIAISKSLQESTTENQEKSA